MKKTFFLTVFFFLCLINLFSVNTGVFGKKTAVRHWFKASIVYENNGMAMVIPADWKDVSDTVKNTDAFFVSDGSTTMPIYDGSLQPLRSAIYVETINDPDYSFEAKEYSKNLKSNKIYSSVSVEASRIKLNCGRDAMFFNIRARYLRSGNIMVMKKIFFTGIDGRTKAVTGFITTAPGNDYFILKSGAMEFVESHVMSAVTDINKLEKKRILDSYKSLPSGLNRAYEKCKNVMEKGSYSLQETVGIYEKTLKKYDYLFSVSNKLARIYLTKENFIDYKRGMQLALKSSEQTQRQDPDSLELLAIAYYRLGERDKALMNMEDAIKINPFNARYIDAHKKMKAGKF